MILVHSAFTAAAPLLFLIYIHLIVHEVQLRQYMSKHKGTTKIEIIND